MAQTPLDLKAAWAKFLAGLLRVLTMGKFWIMVSADLAAYSQLVAKGITPPEFIAVITGGALTLIYAIAKEDAAEKSASPITVTQLPPADAPKP